MRSKVAGLGLTETMITMVIVAVVALQIIQSGSVNALARTHWAARLHATRMAVELSAWVHRGGLLALGVAASDALAAASPVVSCHDGECDATQGAQHYFSQWHTRLLHTIPSARAEICVDQLSAPPYPGWACDSSGLQTVLKLGWPSNATQTDFPPALVVPLGPAT